MLKKKKKKITQVTDYLSIKSLSWKEKKKRKVGEGKKKEKGWNQKKKKKYKEKLCYPLSRIGPEQESRRHKHA